MENIKKNRFVTVLLLAACSLLCICSVFFPILLIVVPGLTAFAIVKFEKPSFAMAVTALVPALALFFVYGAGAELLCMLPIVLAAAGGGILIAILQKSRHSGSDTVFYTALLITGLFYLSIALPGLLSGKGAFDPIRETAATLTEALQKAVSTMPESNTPLFSGQSLQTVIASFPDLIVLCIVPFCFVVGGLSALTGFLFFRLLIKKQREALGIAPLRRFSSWSVPRPYMFGTSLLLIGTLILDLSESESAEAMQLVSVTLIVFPLILQGLCCIDWLIEKRCKKEKLVKTRVIVYALIALFSRFTFTTLLFVGAIEQFMHIRERVVFISRSGGSGPQSPFMRRKSESGNKDTDIPSDKDKTEKK